MNDYTYTNTDGTEASIPRAAFLQLVEAHSVEVLHELGVEKATLRPRFVDVVRPDGSVGVGVVAGHTAEQARASRPSSPSATREAGLPADPGEGFSRAPSAPPS